MPVVQTGQIIAGHRLLERVGAGHFGDVWKAEFEGRTVALKLFDPRLKASSRRREAFAQYALGRVDGEEGRYFPRVETIDIDHEPAYMRMEFVDGRTLGDVLASRSLPLEDRLAVGRRILEALATVHRRGFVHGDLSPSNILVAADGAPKLIDVGFGALFDEAAPEIELSGDEREQSMGVAAPLYAAPERFRTEFLRGCGPAADVFSAGKILYALITGEAPLVIKPVSRGVPSLGPAWDEFIFRCLEEDPARRFPDASAALAEFDRVSRGPSTTLGAGTPTAGEFRAECPECGARMSIPGGWAGERFPCRTCGLPLEVLFYDEQSRHASTAVMADIPEASSGIEFVEEERASTEGPALSAVEGRARKFCPGCGRSIWVEATKCRHCGKWVEDTARRLLADEEERRRRDREAAAAARRSFRLAALGTFLAYLLFWVPGVILNLVYHAEARRVERITGRRPPGMLALEVQMWLFVILPLAAFGLLILIGLLRLPFAFW